MTVTPISKRRGRAGFTAIETVIVVLVLGTLAAMAAPLLNSSLVEARLAAATSEIVSAVEYAQMTAMNTGRPCRVTVDAATATLRVEQQAHADAAALLDAATTEVEAATVEIEETYLEMDHPNHPGSAYTVDLGRSNVAVAKSGMGPDQPLQFSAIGTPSSAAEVTVTTGGRSWRVAVDGLSGAVTHSE